MRISVDGTEVKNYLLIIKVGKVHKPLQTFLHRLLVEGNPSVAFKHVTNRTTTHALYHYLCPQIIGMESKKASESFITMNEIVLPNDTNTFGNLMGGRLMYWMDIAASIASAKHCNAPCMTVSVDNLSFKNPIKLGNVVHIEAKVSRAFNTSMEIFIKVWGEDMVHQYKYESNEAYYTFVALDPTGRPRPVPQVIPETKEENLVFEGALRRRQLRLILGGKMKPDDANELRALFIKD